MKMVVRVIFLVSLVIGIFAFHSRTRLANTFDYEGATYHLPHGYQQTYASPSLNDAALFLSSEPKTGATMMSQELYSIKMVLHNPNGKALTNGTYDFIHNSTDFKNKLTFTSAEVILGYNKEEGRGKAYSASSGVIKVSKWNENYIIEYHLVLNNNKTLTGIYKGQLEDWS